MEITWDLAGRHVAITGAARGLGAALAVVVADAGGIPLLLGRRRAALEATAEAILERRGVQAPVIDLDLADGESVERAAQSILELDQPLDVLVNNGAQWQSGPLETLDPAGIFQTVNSALTGTFLLTRALLPALRRSTVPDVVNIVSMSGIPHTRLAGASVPFYAGKHGQMAFTNGLRQELAGSPIRVIGIYPPIIDAISPLEATWETASQRPKNAMVSTRDVVEAVLFAITRPRNCSITSLVLDADHGGVFSD